MELHDGALMIDSKESQGTCVALIFPKERIFADASASTPIS